MYDFTKKDVIAKMARKQPVHTVCYLKKNLLAAGSSDTTIRIWNYAVAEVMKVIRVDNQAVFALCRIDDNLLASGSSDNKVKIWAYEEGE